MYGRPIRRATILAITGVLVFAGTAFADQLLADGDVVNPGIQGTKPLGNVAAGGLVSADVEFTLTCVGLGHVNVGQTVTLGWSGVGSAPAGGAIVSVTPGAVGPVTAGWAADNQGCPSPVPSMVGTTRSTVTLRAPTTPANGYMYTIVYDRTLTPEDPTSDGNAFSRTATQVSFTLNVVANTPPTLNLPASHSEEGNTTGGWTADWSGVSATDPEDNPDPTPTCLPPAGTVLAVGLTTTVTCSVTDLAGAPATGSFDITVVDTTPPTLAGVPSDRSVTTGDPRGAAVTYAAPTATDIVDVAPVVDCTPASGWTFPVGTTTVTCTATDASGNHSSATFDVTVEYVAPHSASAIWLEPVAGGSVFEANHGRNIPVKVSLFVDGVERSSGQARLTLTPCGGREAVMGLSMIWGGGRWNAALDTSMLPGDCYTVAASIDGLQAGLLRLELTGEASTARSKPSGTAAPTTTLPPKVGPKKPR